MNDKKIKLLNYILLTISIFVMLSFLFYAGKGIESLLSPFILWALSPFFILLCITYYARFRNTLITAMSLSVLFLGAIFLYFDSLFSTHPDAQGALIFLFLPLYQTLAIIIGFCILGIINFIGNRKPLS
jgi:hypothetical protein